MASAGAHAARSTELPAWPLVLLLGGFPLWWITGLTVPVAAVCAAAMAWLLTTRRILRVVPGALLITGFAVWSTASLVMVDTGGRMLGGIYRAVILWCAVVCFLYVSQAMRTLTRRRVLKVLLAVWAFVVVGGVAGMLLPDVQITTVLGRLLPGSLTRNDYVADLFFPRLAEVQHPWGAKEAFVRPSAPFPYANSWGAAAVLLTPVALASLVEFRARRVRWVIAGLLVVSVFPAVATSNRAMFACLALGALVAVTRMAWRGRWVPAVSMVVAGVVGLVALIATGAIASMLERQETGRSSDVRGRLYAETWQRTLDSPLLGWGAPRPSLTEAYSVGTQGYVWTVMFSFGLVGLALFLAFLWRTTAVSLRGGDLVDVFLAGTLVGTCAMVWVYGLDIIQLVVLCVVAALLMRERGAWDWVSPSTVTPLEDPSLSAAGAPGHPAPAPHAAPQAVPRETTGRGGLRGAAIAGALNLVGGALGAAIALVTTVVVARQLGDAGAGVFFVGVAVITVIANVAELGTDTGLVRFIAGRLVQRRAADIRAVVRLALVPVALLGVVLVAAALLLAPVVLPAWSPLAVGAVALGSVALTLTAVLLAIGRGLNVAGDYPLVWSILLPVLRLGAVLLVAGTGGDAQQVLVAWALAALVPCVCAALLAARRLRVALSSCDTATGGATEPARLRRQWWEFCSRRGLAAAVEVCVEWVDVIVVALLASPAAAGVYAVLSRCVRAGEIAQQANRISIAPQIAASLQSHDRPAARRLHTASVLVMLVVAWPFYLTLIVFGDVVLSVFGAEFVPGWPALCVLAVALSIAAAGGSVQTVVLMGGRSGWQLLNKTVALIVILVLCVVLVPVWGVVGAAWAWACAIAVETALVLAQARRVLGARLFSPAVVLVGLAVVVGAGGALSLARLALGGDLGGLAAGIGGLAVVALLGLLAALRWSPPSLPGLLRPWGGRRGAPRTGSERRALATVC